MKKARTDPYYLQFGRTIPKRYFEIPDRIYTPAFTYCDRLKHGRRVFHKFQFGDPCGSCVKCFEDGLRRCESCQCTQWESIPQRFVQEVQVYEKGNGLLDTKLNRPYRFRCMKCAAEKIANDPQYPLCVYPSPHLLYQVCELNAKDFPPAWAIGQKRFRESSVICDVNDKKYNLWNPILEAKRKTFASTKDTRYKVVSQ